MRLLDLQLRLFLFCLIRVVMPPVNIKIVPAPGLFEVLIIVGYVGLLFRKKVAYMLCIIPSLIVVALLIAYPGAWNDTEFVVLAVLFGLILVTASICGLTCRRQRNSRASNEKVEP